MHSLVDVTMTTEHATPYWVWGVETEDGVTTVRAAAPSYDELLKTIGTEGPEIPLTDDCDGICDVFPATPELCDEIRKHWLSSTENVAIVKESTPKSRTQSNLTYTDIVKIPVLSM